MPRYQPPAVFDMRLAFNQRFCQVADLACNTEQNSQDDRVINRDVKGTSGEHCDDYTTDDAANDAFPGFAWADYRRQFVASEKSARKEGHRIIGPDACQDHQNQPEA